MPRAHYFVLALSTSLLLPRAPSADPPAPTAPPITLPIQPAIPQTLPSTPTTLPTTTRAAPPATAPATLPIAPPATTRTAATAPLLFNIPVAVPTDPRLLLAASKMVHEVYKDEYAKTAPADKLALGRKLLSDALESHDQPNVRYFLLREAIDLTSAGGDFTSAMEATDALCSGFLVDTRKTKALTLEALARVAAAQQPHMISCVARQFLELTEESMKLDAYADASRYALRAATLARDLRDPQLTRRTDQILAASKLGETDLERYNAARETLTRTPGDQLANTVVGRFLCVVRRDFAAGVPLLAKGFDPDLKAVAAQEIKAGKIPNDLAAAADAWWDLATKLGKNDPANGAFRGHIHALYARALSLASLDEAAKDKFGAVPRSMAKSRAADIEAEGDVSEDITVTSALWGIPKKSAEGIVIEKGADVTATLKDLFRYQGTVIIQSNTSFLGDPAPGKAKALQLVYTYHDHEFTDNIYEDYLLSFPPLPADGLTVPTSDFRIVEAYWGHSNNWLDITAKFRLIMKSPSTPLKPSPKTLYLTDPDPKITKHLIILYELAGKRYFKTVAEDQALLLDGK